MRRRVGACVRGRESSCSDVRIQGFEVQRDCSRRLREGSKAALDGGVCGCGCVWVWVSAVADEESGDGGGLGCW